VKFTPLIAGALSAAAFAGVAVLLFAYLSGLWVWAAFVGWASYDQSGADRRALFTSSVCMVGVVMAWLVALVVVAGVTGLPGAPASALAAALASFLIVWASRYAPLSNVPATFYGFASPFAFLLLSNRAFSIDALTHWDFGNALVCIPLSLLIGSALGVLHQRLAFFLTAAGNRTAPGSVRLTPPARKD
jgi:Protein of unknown function (DUF1097)